MIQIRFFFGILLFCTALFWFNLLGSTQLPKKNSSKIVLNKRTINPLVCGDIYKVSGNQMPDPDRPHQFSKGVSRVILIYSLTNRTKTEGDGVNLFTKINTKRIKKVTSNKTGRFCVNLPLGKYSLFIEEPGFGIYANIFDDKMNICPIEVKKRKNADIVLKITHSATF